jgi:hypothetical protein
MNFRTEIEKFTAVLSIGLNSRVYCTYWQEHRINLSRPVLGPTQPPTKCVPVWASRGVIFFIFLIILIGIVGVESNWVHSALRPLIGLLCQSRVIMMTEKLVEWLARGNRSIRRIPAPVPLCPPQTPHAARTKTRAAAVGSQRLTAWATARPASNFVPRSRCMWQYASLPYTYSWRCA